MLAKLSSLAARAFGDERSSPRDFSATSCSVAVPVVSIDVTGADAEQVQPKAAGKDEVNNSLAVTSFVDGTFDLERFFSHAYQSLVTTTRQEASGSGSPGADASPWWRA